MSVWDSHWASSLQLLSSQYVFRHPSPQSLAKSERRAIIHLNKCPQSQCIGPPRHSEPYILPFVSSDLFGETLSLGNSIPWPLSCLGLVSGGHFHIISTSSLPFISLIWAMSSFLTNFLDLEQPTHLISTPCCWFWGQEEKAGLEKNSTSTERKYQGSRTRSEAK